MNNEMISILWLLLCSGLVFLMQAGFLCLESGLTRSKNSINVAIKNLTDFGISVLLYWMIGFGLMYGSSYFGYFGTNNFFFSFENHSAWNTVFFIYQSMFCGTAVTIIAGAVAERIHFPAYIFISILTSMVIYPIFGHWAWGTGLGSELVGWLGTKGFVDFAGATIVHSLGGWVALAMVLIVGPREGRFPLGEKPRQIQGGHLQVAILGVLLLWVGWIGFNGGSVYEFNERVSHIIGNTFLGGSSGLIAALVVGWFIRGYPDISFPMNGSLAGLVAVTASCNAIDSTEAILIGAIGGAVMLIGEYVLEKFKIDDVISAVPVHLMAGIWGTVAVALFGDLEILGTGLSRAQQLKVQILGIVTCGFWAFTVTYLIGSFTNYYFPFRVNKKDEKIGLNISEHNAHTDLYDLMIALDQQEEAGDFDFRLPVEPFSEMGYIAQRFNQVLDSLNKTASKADAIIKTVEAGIITFLRDTFDITSMNPGAEVLFGCSYQQVYNQPITRLIKADDFKPEKGPRKVQGVYADGSPLSLEMAVTETEMEGETFYTATFRDVSEKENYEEEIVKRSKDLEKINKDLHDAREATLNILEDFREEKSRAEAASKAKSEFLANMSHEIRTPLNAVLGFANLLKDTKLDSEQQEFTNTITDSGELLLEIINDILDISKIEVKQVALETIDFNLQNLVEGIVKIGMTRAGEKPVKLVTEYQESMPFDFKGDPTRIRQILLNLVGNAIKFTHRGEIKVRVSGDKIEDEDKYRVQLSVKDSGVGIPENRQKDVFESFTQADMSTTRLFGGTGLGLSIAKMLVELMEGEIWVESEVGKGSEFFFYIPLEESEPIAEQEISLTGLKNLAGKKAILIDNDSTAIKKMEEYLKKVEMSVLMSFTSSNDVLDWLLKAKTLPDIVIVNDLMPGLSGYDLGKKIHDDENLKELKLMLTATDAGPGSANRAKENGFQAFLPKPIAPDEFYKVIQAALGDARKSGQIITRHMADELSCKGLRILVVEDNSINQKFIKALLEKLGCQCDMAGNGQAAIKKFETEEYDICLMDLQMPVMNGIEATKILREQLNIEVPIIALTAAAMKEDEEASYEAGMNGFLTKPVQVEKLKKTLIQWGKKKD